jgi:hypothetical protein
VTDDVCLRTITYFWKMISLVDMGELEVLDRFNDSESEDATSSVDMRTRESSISPKHA